MKSLHEAIRPTTFLEPEKLRKHLGLNITIATETFQHTGSFKFRAAYNLALNAPNDEILTALGYKPTGPDTTAKGAENP